jgi:hypothetical protein
LLPNTLLTIWNAGDPDRTLATTATATTIAMVTKKRKAISAITLQGALEFRITKLNLYKEIMDY